MTFHDSLSLLLADGRWQIYTKLFNVEGPAVTGTLEAAHWIRQTEVTSPESHRDLLEAPFLTLATVGPTGRPQLSTVCFLASATGPCSCR